VRTIVIILFCFAAALPIRGAELDRFWRGFPGFTNTLASYGYDRGFASDAQPEFVDEVVRDAAKKPSKQRMNEYALVLYFMDSKTVTERLATFDRSSSAAVRGAVSTIRLRLKVLDRETGRE
jgi:hypothetical protein